MSIHEKLENSSLKIKKKLYDNILRLKGTAVQCIKIKEVLDKYKDVQDVSIIENATVTAYIDDLGLEIPLNRYRIDSTTTTAIDKESVYFFDVIPIDAYFQWNDKVEFGDIIVLVIKDGTLKIPVCFRIGDMVGRLSKNILLKKYKVAVYNPSMITTEIRNLIVNYINNN